MSLKGEPSPYVDLSTTPPLGGELGTPSLGGESAPSKVLTSKTPLPWFKCARCGRMVLSYKKTRGIHNKKCPPWADLDTYQQNLFDNIIDSTKME